MSAISTCPRRDAHSDERRPAVPDRVFVVSEHEPDESDFPVVIKGVFSTLQLAEAFIATQERRYWTEDNHDPDDIWWELEEWGIDGKVSAIECYCNPESGDGVSHHPVYPHPLCPECPDGRILPPRKEPPHA